MLAHAILKFLLCLSNVGLIANLTGCFVYDTHFPAFSIVATFSINFWCVVAVAGSIHEVERYDSIHKFPEFRSPCKISLRLENLWYDIVTCSHVSSCLFRNSLRIAWTGLSTIYSFLSKIVHSSRTESYIPFFVHSLPSFHLFPFAMAFPTLYSSSINRTQTPASKTLKTPKPTYTSFAGDPHHQNLHRSQPSLVYQSRVVPAPAHMLRTVRTRHLRQYTMNQSKSCRKIRTFRHILDWTPDLWNFYKKKSPGVFLEC